MLDPSQVIWPHPQQVSQHSSLNEGYGSTGLQTHPSLLTYSSVSGSCTFDKGSMEKPFEIDGIQSYYVHSPSQFHNSSIMSLNSEPSHILPHGMQPPLYSSYQSCAPGGAETLMQSFGPQTIVLPDAAGITQHSRETALNTWVPDYIISYSQSSDQGSQGNATFKKWGLETRVETKVKQWLLDNYEMVSPCNNSSISRSSFSISLHSDDLYHHCLSDSQTSSDQLTKTQFSAVIREVFGSSVAPLKSECYVGLRASAIQCLLEPKESRGPKGPTQTHWPMVATDPMGSGTIHYCRKCNRIGNIIKMFNCSVCKKWTHRHCCTKFNFIPVTGDNFICYICSHCNNGQEYLQKFDLDLVNVVYLGLLNLTLLYTHRYYFHICVVSVWIECNWNRLQCSVIYSTESIINVLKENTDLFCCLPGNESKWRLKVFQPPPTSNINLQGIVNLVHTHKKNDEIITVSFHTPPEIISPNSDSENSIISALKEFIPVREKNINTRENQRYPLQYFTERQKDGPMGRTQIVTEKNINTRENQRYPLQYFAERQKDGPIHRTQIVPENDEDSNINNVTSFEALLNDTTSSDIRYEHIDKEHLYIKSSQSSNYYDVANVLVDYSDYPKIKMEMSSNEETLNARTQVKNDGETSPIKFVEENSNLFHIEKVWSLVKDTPNDFETYDEININAKASNISTACDIAPRILQNETASDDNAVYFSDHERVTKSSFFFYINRQINYWKYV